MSFRWLHHECAYLDLHWTGSKSAPEIGRVLDKSTGAVIERARSRGLPVRRESRLPRTEPSKAEWVRIATVVAREAQVSPCKLLAGVRERRICEARWKAWRAILIASPNYSIAGVGRVSGFHWTTILHGLERSKALESAGRH